MARGLAMVVTVILMAIRGDNFRRSLALIYRVLGNFSGQGLRSTNGKGIGHEYESE